MTHATVGQAATGWPETNSPLELAPNAVELLHVSMLLNRAALIVRQLLVHVDAEAARATLAREAAR
jgi:hypothetical protein